MFVVCCPGADDAAVTCLRSVVQELTTRPSRDGSVEATRIVSRRQYEAAVQHLKFLVVDKAAFEKGRARYILVTDHIKILSFLITYAFRASQVSYFSLNRY